jgi:hypothetical protein
MSIENNNEKIQLIVSESVLPQVINIINGYNRKAEKWGYELLTLNSDNTITGKFTPKEDPNAGFMQKMKEAYKNGDLEEEWKKILKLCGIDSN